MKTKLSFANKKRLLLLFVLLLSPFLFDVHPPGNFSGYGLAIGTTISDIRTARC